MNLQDMWQNTKLVLWSCFLLFLNHWTSWTMELTRPIHCKLRKVVCEQGCPHSFGNTVYLEPEPNWWMENIAAACGTDSLRPVPVLYLLIKQFVCLTQPPSLHITDWWLLRHDINHVRHHAPLNVYTVAMEIKTLSLQELNCQEKVINSWIPPVPNNLRLSAETEVVPGSNSLWF